MTWLGANRIETSSGKTYDFTNPRPSSIDLDDIAHALSNICRFGGHTREFYSVAEHSVLVSRIVELRGGGLNEQIGGLFHDGHEAYVIDVPKPLKPLLGHAYAQLAKQADWAICAALDLDILSLTCSEVEEADLEALFNEGNALMPAGPGAPPTPLPGGLNLKCQAPPMAQLSFIARANTLFDRRKCGAEQDGHSAG